MKIYIGSDKIIDLDVVHSGGELDLIDHDLNVIFQAVKCSFVFIILTFYLRHEVCMLSKGLVNRGLVLSYIGYETALCAPTVTL